MLQTLKYIFECIQHLTMPFRNQAVEICICIMRSRGRYNRQQLLMNPRLFLQLPNPEHCNNIYFHASIGLSTLYAVSYGILLPTTIFIPFIQMRKLRLRYSNNLLKLTWPALGINRIQICWILNLDCPIQQIPSLGLILPLLRMGIIAISASLKV